tara:strand:+ start:774 stop:1193 length:420 start_codon:yes stop_codon:yes gene_type:complete
MSRLLKLKRQIIKEANKRILKEETDCPCYDGTYDPLCCDIELEHTDSTELNHLLNVHPESHTFLDSLNHKVHAHLGPDNHLTLEFPHLGPRHNIELDLEGSYPSHNEHDEYPKIGPHIIFGGGIKIPIKSFGKHNKGHH